MKLKTKLFAPLFVILFMGMATSAFADLNCAITVVPLVARETVNNNSANTGDLLFTCTAPTATPTTEGSVTVAYGLPIVNTTSTGDFGTHAISITTDSLSGSFLVAGQRPVIDTTRADAPAGINRLGGQVAILIPAQAVPGGGTFALRNVLITLAGGPTAGQQDLKANINILSQTGNTVLTNTTPVIISSVLNSLSSAPALAPKTTPAQFQANGQTLGSTAGCTTQTCIDDRSRFTVSVQENYIDAWRTRTQYYLNGRGLSPNGTDVTFTFSGMQPGSSITNCVLTMPGATFWNLTGSGIANAAGVATFVAELSPTSPATDIGAIETLRLSCGTSQATPAYSAGISTAPATTNITVVMNQSPVGNAFAGGNDPIITTPLPRFQTGTTVGPLTVITFTGASTGQTTMIVPWATGSGAAAPPAGTFNTGIVVANTTGDPAAFGVNAASDSAGSIAFYFFPADGSAGFTITPTTGFNLSGGVIPSGGSFIGLVSDILKAGQVTTTFTGYIIVVANFTHAHGSAFVFGGVGAADRITSAQDVLVINNPASSSRDIFGAALNVESVAR